MFKSPGLGLDIESTDSIHATLSRILANQRRDLLLFLARNFDSH